MNAIHPTIAAALQHVTPPQQPVMAIRNLSVLAYAQGFTHWHYDATKCGHSLQEVRGAGYFRDAADMMKSGDFLSVSAEDGGGLFYVISADRGVSVALMAGTVL